MRRQDGQASVEVLGMLPLLLLVAMLMWQLHLAVSTATTATNAARTGSRVLGLGGDAEKAALAALPKHRRETARIRVTGQRVTVEVKVPLLVSGLSAPLWNVTQSAELPDT